MIHVMMIISLKHLNLSQFLIYKLSFFQNFCLESRQNWVLNGTYCIPCKNFMIKKSMVMFALCIFNKLKRKNIFNLHFIWLQNYDFILIILFFPSELFNLNEFSIVLCEKLILHFTYSLKYIVDI